MKLAPTLLTGVAIAGLLAFADVKLQGTTPLLAPAFADEGKDATGLTLEQKIDLITKNKDMIGSGDQLRRFFFGDLEPIGFQPGGAGMVVNLYNKANDYTFSYCSAYDVVIAVKQGRVEKFAADEVK